MSMLNRTQKFNNKIFVIQHQTQFKKESDISAILTKIKAQNAARKADEVLNNQLMIQESSIENTRGVNQDNNESVDATTSITLGYKL